jgi:ectoine hydroxylase-related dioxygenase (phytanoyl-CoA dioxygenase family)
MKLTATQVQNYIEQGWLFIPVFLSKEEIEIIRAEISALISSDAPGSLLESDKRTVRALHGCHLNSSILRCLTMHPKLLEPSKQLLGSEVYVHQFKVNLKAAFSGDIWRWHQDFVFWHEEDSMPVPRVVNVVLFLDEVNEFNGPLYLIPGSHQYGTLSEEVHPKNDDSADQSDWSFNFSADLRFTVNNAIVDSLVREKGIVAPKGPVGSLLFFHSNLVHGSAPNISPYARNLIITTYNSVENLPQPLTGVKGRPEFLVSRDYTPLKSVAEDALLRDALRNQSTSAMAGESPNNI